MKIGHRSRGGFSASYQLLRSLTQRDQSTPLTTEFPHSLAQPVYGRMKMKGKKEKSQVLRLKPSCKRIEKVYVIKIEKGEVRHREEVILRLIFIAARRKLNKSL